MKKLIMIVAFASVAALLASCSDDAYIKTFKCSNAYPYLNLEDNHCYKSEDEARKANEEAAKNQTNKEESADDSADKADGSSGNEDGDGKQEEPQG